MDRLHIAIAAILLITVIVGCVLFQYYQHQISLATLQGYWHLRDNVYLLINGSVIQFVQFDSNSMIELYKDTNATIEYKSILPTKSHRYQVRISSNQLPYQLSPTLELELFPVVGVLVVSTSKNNKQEEVMRLVKDNAMSNVHVITVKSIK